MDLYDESEHVISSDEYSDGDDDDEALMNDAIRAHHKLYECSKDFSHRSKEPNFKMNQKQKELSSLIRKNKISIIYKNKSIRWLNGKKQRERYKELIYKNKGKNIKLEENAKETIKIENDPIFTQDAVDIADSDSESITYIKTNQRDLLEINNEVVEEKINIELKDIDETKENAEKLEKTRCGNKKEILIPEKGDRSLTPKIVYKSSELKQQQSEKGSHIESPQFYRDINDMFPKFDNIATEHINTITKNTLTSVEENMKTLINDISTLSEILNTKETEWNRLLHLKMVKEEIYTRLRQKRKILLMENYAKIETHRNLKDLKELELYLSIKKPISPGASFSTITLQKLIEKRANMNAEDLEKEKNNTNRLHSLLVSSNMLHGKESSESVTSISNGEGFTSKNNELFKQLTKEALVSKRGRQGDVKSIIENFREKNSEILPLAGKQNNLSNSVLEEHNHSIPVHDKKISSQYFHIRRQSDTFPLGNSVEDFSISTIGRFKKLSPKQNNDSSGTMNNHFNVTSKNKDLKNRGQTDFAGKLIKNINYPLCQECKINESRFVCAGCGNQWYCSKKCQVSAWDKHSDFCTE